MVICTFNIQFSLHVSRVCPINRLLGLEWGGLKGGRQLNIIF